MLNQNELIEKVRHYNPYADTSMLEKAYAFSQSAHQKQKRANGDPYFLHPVAVAALLSEKRLDDSSIITGLLHDVLEDTLVTKEELKEQFSSEIVDLVSGVTKLSHLKAQPIKTQEAENFRKLVMAISLDIRVLLVKLADRLHNMRTLHFIDNVEHRERVALETKEIYVPLAERIGLSDWKDELEDIAFKELNPDGYHSIVTRLSNLRQMYHAAGVEETIKTLKALCATKNMDAHIHGREKRPSSILRKTLHQNTSFEQLTDITAFRIIVPSKQDCYAMLGYVHEGYQLVPGRFKDYISLPKSSGYQSLHTTLIGEEGRRIEIQIRSQAMHYQAEYGIAAHWHYKQGKPVEMQNEGMKYGWVRHLIELLDNSESPQDFLEHTKLDLYTDQVFVFTPKGEIKALPKGSTVIDFAYMVHSDIGNHCTAARINGRMASIKKRLRNGDQVDILTSHQQSPSREWMAFVRTGRARSAIRRANRENNRHFDIKSGQESLKQSVQEVGCSYDEKMLVSLLEKFHKDSTDSLLAAIGQGDLSSLEVRKALFPDVKSTHLRRKEKKHAKKSKKTDSGFIIQGIDGDIPIKIAKCCHPIPGDSIIGKIASGRGITIHSKECKYAADFFEGKKDYYLEVDWFDYEDILFTGRIEVLLADEKKALENLTVIIGKEGGIISQIKVIARMLAFSRVLVDIKVPHISKLEVIIACLRRDGAVTHVRRRS